MPLYQFKCPNEQCIYHKRGFECRLPVARRDQSVSCVCGVAAKRVMATPHVAPIGGIHNKLNAGLNESGTPIDVGRHDAFIDGATKRSKT